LWADIVSFPQELESLEVVSLEAIEEV